MRARVTLSISVLATSVVAIVLASCPAMGSTNSEKNPAVTWPATVTGRLITDFTGGNPKSLPTGTAITPQAIAKSKDGYAWVSSFSGNTGYALAYLNGFQYPLVSRNNGETWATSSCYWSGPWADASAGANYISAFSSTTAAAYGNQWLYSTDDAGRQWYLTTPFNVESVESSSVEWWVPHVPTNGIIVDVSQNGTYKNADKVIGRAQYLTTNGGKTWRRLPLPK